MSRLPSQSFRLRALLLVHLPMWWWSEATRDRSPQRSALSLTLSGDVPNEDKQATNASPADYAGATRYPIHLLCDSRMKPDLGLASSGQAPLFHILRLRTGDKGHTRLTETLACSCFRTITNFVLPISSKETTQQTKSPPIGRLE